MMRAAPGTDTIVLIDGPRTLRISIPGRARIGRHRTNDVVVDHPAASRFHAEVRWDERGRPVVVDSHSHNGTFVDGVPVYGASLLRDGAEITLADHTVRVRLEASEAPAVIAEELGEITVFKDPGAERSGHFVDSKTLHRMLLDLESDHETGVLTLADEAVSGTLTFAQGRIAAAKLDERSGLDALERLLRLTRGSYAVSSTFEPCEGTLDLSIRHYLKAGYWEHIDGSRRWRRPKKTQSFTTAAAAANPALEKRLREIAEGDDAEGSDDGLVAGQIHCAPDLWNLLDRLERDARTGFLRMRLGSETFVLTLGLGRILSMHHDGRPQRLRLKPLGDSAREGGQYVFIKEAEFQRGAGLGRPEGQGGVE